VRGSVPTVGDRVLLRNVGLQGKTKIVDRYKKETFLVAGQQDRDIPVYQIQPESGKGGVRTVHRNLLLPLVLPLDQHVPVRRKQKEKIPATDVAQPISAVESSDEEFVMFDPRDPDLNVESTSEHADTETSENTDQETDPEDIPEQPAVPLPAPGPRRSGRKRRPPEYLRSGDFVLHQQRLDQPDAIAIIKDLVSYLNSSQRVVEILLERINHLCT